MSARDRRLREAARERDRSRSSSTDESSFDRGLREAAERQSREGSRQRPGRGTEERTVERETRDRGRDESAFDEGLRQAAERQGSDRDRDRRPDRGVESGQDVQETIDRAIEGAGEVADRATDALESASSRFSEEVSEFAERPVRQNVREAIGTGADIETRVRTEREQALVRGVGEIFNVPGTALAFGGAVEFAGARAGEVAAGRPGEAAEAITRSPLYQLGEAGVEFVGERAGEVRRGETETAFEETREVVTSPEFIETAVFGAGALIGSGAAITGLSRVAPRAGRAAAFGIQPGEELIGVAGARSLRAAGRPGAAERLFPGEEPLILSEEAAIRGARRAGRGALEAGRRVREAGRRVDIDFPVGAGVPAPRIRLESRTESVREPELRLGRGELETETLIREAERERFELEERFLRDPIRFETEFETEARRGFRAQPLFRFEDPFETAATIEDTLEGLEPIGETEIEFESEAEAELEAQAEAEAELIRELEFESLLEREQELEIEPFDLEAITEGGRDIFDPDPFGVRTVETTIRALEDRE